jgi:hypothetical protein
VTQSGQATPTWHINPIGGFAVTGPWRMARHVVVVSLVGGTRVRRSRDV